MSEFDPVYDPAEVRRLTTKARSLVAEPWHLNTESIASEGWIVVPTEKARHFEEAQAQALARAMREREHEHCYAVATEPTGVHPQVYRMAATATGLLKFSEECAGLNCIVLPDAASFAVLCTSEDYNLYAGPADFVRRALGTDIATARASFLEYASDEWWEGRLLEVAQRYGVTGT